MDNEELKGFIKTQIDDVRGDIKEIKGDVKEIKGDVKNLDSRLFVLESTQKEILETLRKLEKFVPVDHADGFPMATIQVKGSPFLHKSK